MNAASARGRSPKSRVFPFAPLVLLSPSRWQPIISLRSMPSAVPECFFRWMTKAAVRSAVLECSASPPRIHSDSMKASCASSFISSSMPRPDFSQTAGRFLAWPFHVKRVSDAIVPMPLHWRKRWQRGFNQAGLLAREISRRTNTPVRNALRRVKFTAVQAGLTNAKRRANVSGAFRPKTKKSLAGQCVLLVDDVMTTGATAASCARALKMAGARRVVLLTLARVDRRHAFDPQFLNPNYSSDREYAQS